MCSFCLSPFRLIAQHPFDAAAASAECSIIVIGPLDEPGIPVFGYYEVGWMFTLAAAAYNLVRIRNLSV